MFERRGEGEAYVSIVICCTSQGEHAFFGIFCGFCKLGSQLLHGLIALKIQTFNKKCPRMADNN